MVTVVDDDDLKDWGLYSEESLLDKYRQAQDILKEATPREPEFLDNEYFAKKERRNLGIEAPLLGQNTASNHWVVHGNHTETGMPLFASDPHLGNMIPSAW